MTPRSGTLFVFINRNKTMVRSLIYDGTGFWLMTKRLSKGRF
jgi:transposase